MKRFEEKKRKKKNRKLVVYRTIAVISVAAIVVVVGIGHIIGKKKVDTSQGIKVIQTAEKADVTAIETKIEKLEIEEQGERSLKERFASSIVIGDSITEGFTAYDVLNASSILSKIGGHYTDLSEQYETVRGLNPKYVFISYGMNDVIGTDGDTEAFKAAYKEQIKKFQKEFPDTKIYINSIFPAQAHAIEEQPVLANVPQYNEALQEMCDQEEIAFIDNTELVSEEYYAEDGIHFQPDFYPVWGERMAEVASL